MWSRKSSQDAAWKTGHIVIVVHSFHLLKLSCTAWDSSTSQDHCWSLKRNLQPYASTLAKMVEKLSWGSQVIKNICKLFDIFPILYLLFHFFDVFIIISVISLYSSWVSTIVAAHVIICLLHSILNDKLLSACFIYEQQGVVLTW